jgi:hypothetical protein
MKQVSELPAALESEGNYPNSEAGSLAGCGSNPGSRPGSSSGTAGELSLTQIWFRLYF